MSANISTGHYPLKATVILKLKSHRRKNKARPKYQERADEEKQELNASMAKAVQTATHWHELMETKISQNAYFWDQIKEKRCVLSGKQL